MRAHRLIVDAHIVFEVHEPVVLTETGRHVASVPASQIERVLARGEVVLDHLEVGPPQPTHAEQRQLRPVRVVGVDVVKNIDTSEWRQSINLAEDAQVHLKRLLW